MDLQTYSKIPNNTIIFFDAKWSMSNHYNELLKPYEKYIIKIDFDNSIDIVKYENITKIPTIICYSKQKHKIEGISLLKLKRLLKAFDSQ